MWTRSQVLRFLDFIRYSSWISQFSSVAQSCPNLCDPMNRSTPARPPCPSPMPGVHPNPCPLCRWCHPTISSSVVPFSSRPQSFPASGSFQMSQLSASGGQSIGVSASTSILPMNTQDWSPLGWTGLISLQSKGLLRVFSITTVQKHQFFSTQPSLWSSSQLSHPYGPTLTSICFVWGGLFFIPLVDWLGLFSTLSLFWDPG